MKTVSLPLLLALLIIGVIINVATGSGYGYIPAGIYVVLWGIGAVRYR
jgi:hypothetical protein